MHDASLDRCRDFINGHLNRHQMLKIADVGAYDVNGTYRPLFDNPGWTYTGIDVAKGPNVDIVVPSDGDWGLNEQFDVVISGQCLEHVAAPWRWIHQIAQLAKPGGLIWVTAPNTWPFHEHPIDAWRVWPDGLRALFAEGGLIDLGCDFIHTETFGVAQKPNNSYFQRNAISNLPNPRFGVGSYLYKRVGYDERVLKLEQNGSISDGSAGCEQTWSMNTNSQGTFLTIFGEQGVPTCHLARQVDGVYIGNWLEFERMPIELIPIPVCHPSDLQPSWHEDFYVGIPTLNRHDLLELCIESVLSSTALPKAIFVVENSGSWPNSTQPHWSGHISNRVRVLRPPTNLGVARSWNLLQKLCQPSPLIILNDDIEVRNNLFEKMLESPEQFVTGNIHQAFCAFMIRNNAWAKVGEFDESFYPAYFEDNDYARRLLLSGFPINATAEIGYKDNGPSATKASFSPLELDEFNRSFDIGKRYYNLKWGGPPRFEVYKTPFGDPISDA